MPNTRDSSATITNDPVRQLQSLIPTMPSMAWPADRLNNLSSIATHSLTATYALWSELFENQKRLTVRLLNAMGASNKAQTNPPQLSDSSLVNSIVDNRDNKHEQRLDSLIEGVSPSGASAPRPRGAAPKATPSKSEFPIKRYDTLTVQEIAGKLDRLRDHRALRTVLAYEAKNKARKGVAAAGEARLKHLSDL